jgi:LysM repeat protein
MSVGRREWPLPSSLISSSLSSARPVRAVRYGFRRSGACTGGAQRARHDGDGVDAAGPAGAAASFRAAPQAAQPHPGGWSAQGGSRVTVRQGDTVAALSSRYNVPEDAIRQANGLSGGQQIAAGQSIVIPTFSQPGGQPRSVSLPSPAARSRRSPTSRRCCRSSRGCRSVRGRLPHSRGDGATSGAPAAGGTYKVVAGDTLSGISRRTGVSVDALKQANNLVQRAHPHRTGTAHSRGRPGAAADRRRRPRRLRRRDGGPPATQQQASTPAPSASLPKR